MNKNIIITYLIIAIAILVGYIILTNYVWFSEGWLIGLGIIAIGIGTGAILAYFKIVR